MALSVDIILNARDEASGHVEKFGKGLRDTTKSIQAAAGSLLSELNPALGSLVASLTNAARVAAQLPTILGAVTVGVAATTAAFVPYVAVLAETRRRQVDLNLAVQGLDFQSISAQAKAAAREFAQFDNTLLGLIRTLTRTEGAFNVLDFLSGRKALEAFRKELEAAAAVLAPLESGRLSAEGFLKQNKALQDQLQLRQDLAREVASEQDFLEAANQLAIALQKQVDAQERLLQLRAKIRLATPGVTPAERALIEQERDLDLLALREQSRAQFGLLGFRTRQGALAIREQRLLPSGLAAGEAPEGEGGEGGLTAAGIARATAAIRAADERAINLERERLSLFQQIPGLLREQQAALDLQLVGLERRRLSEAGLLTDANELNLRLQEQIISMGELARTDPTAGLAAGFRDLQDTFLSTGQILREGVLDLGHDLSRAFSDSFFNVVTGDFKKLAQLPQQFAQALVRTVTDALGRVAIGSVLRQLGFGAFVPAISPLALPAAGGVALPAGAQATFQALVQAGIPAEQAAASAIQSAQMAGGGGGGIGLPLVPIPSGGLTGFLPASVQSFLQTPFFATAAQAQGAAELAGIVPGTVAGFTPLQAFGAGAGAIGLGLTIFNALQGPPTPLNVISSGASGALSGALIGSAFPGPGTVIGAIAGGILGGGAALFGKGGRGRKPSAAARSAQEAQTGASNLSAAIDRAQTLQDMVQVLNTVWTPFDQVIILAYADGPPRIGTASGSVSDRVLAQVRASDRSHPFTVGGFLTDPRFIENLSIQVGAVGSPVHDEALTAKARDKLRALTGQLSGIQVGFEEFLAEAPGALVPAFGARTIVRTTIRPATRLEEARGQQLFIAPGILAGLTDDQAEQLLRQLAEVDADRSINILTRDPDTDVLVSVTTGVPRGAVSLPAPAPATNTVPASGDGSVRMKVEPRRGEGDVGFI